MNLKGRLAISTSLMVVCVGLMTSFAHAIDYGQTNTIETSQLKVIGQYKAADGTILQQPLIKLVPDNQSSFTLGKEMMQIGGDYDSQEQKIPMSLSIFGRPYGNYNAGCTLCVFSSADGMNGAGGQAAISGLDYRASESGVVTAATVAAVADGDMAAVGFYHYDENSSARLLLEAASFGPGVVTLSIPMGEEQMSQLHEGMYIATNVIDPAFKKDDTLLRSYTYWGFIKSWDSTHIYVYAWAVLGIPNKDDRNYAPGQVPDIKYLDNQLSNYKVPMIFVGVPDKVFAENTYMVADGSKVLGDKATAVANKFEREEFDFRAKNWTKANSLSFHGWTTSFECRPNCDPRALSEDSYAYLVNGPDGLPRAYVALTVGDALEFSGYSTFIGGNGAPQHVDDNGNVSEATVGSNHIMSSFASALPSNNTIHMNTIVNRETVSLGDWHDYSVRLVMDVDSQRDRKKGLINGSHMGSIAFNYNAEHYGGICMLGYDSNQGLCQEGDGSVSFNNNIFVNPGKILYFKTVGNNWGSYLSVDDKGNFQIGTQVANGANIRGVNGYYGQSLDVSQQVSATKFISKLSTPSSSSESCTAGEFKDDANYHYVCVAANKWKRAALSDF